MDEREKITLIIKEKIPWLTQTAFFGHETDGILYQAYDPELGETCWVKIMFGNRLFLSYNLHHEDWIHIAEL